VGRKGPRSDAPAIISHGDPYHPDQTDENGHVLKVRDRKAKVRGHRRPSGVLLKLEKQPRLRAAQSIISRVREEIDAAYIVYNEFKS